MQSVIATTVALAGLVSTVAGHGFVIEPTARMPGSAMASACGQQVENNQKSDNYGMYPRTPSTLRVQLC